MTTITALFSPPIRPRLTILEQRLDALDRARRLAASTEPTNQEN